MFANYYWLRSKSISGHWMRHELRINYPVHEVQRDIALIRFTPLYSLAGFDSLSIVTYLPMTFEVQGNCKIRAYHITFIEVMTTMTTAV
ncbi:hypothetical protein GJ496_010548 [Pomphorhynchus laevis]|nr:hypothetical protein GJ496_010548 [Pomphorhynchus laevis]